MHEEDECPECGGRLISGNIISSCTDCGWTNSRNPDLTNAWDRIEIARQVQLETQHHAYVKQFRAMWTAFPHRRIL